MTVHIHDLTASHIDQLKQHFDALNDEDVHMRFGNNLSHEARHAYVDGINFDRDSVFGVYADNLTLLGVAHLACMAGAAELGLSVLPAYRSHGIGSALFKRAAMRARNLQIVELFMNCLAHNAAIMHIARKAGMKIIIEQGGADAFLELSPGTPLTLGQDLAEQGLARFDWVMKANLDCMRRLTDVIR